MLARPGATVRRGDPILELDEPTLPAALAVLEAERHELEVRRDVALTTDRVSANLLADQAQRAAGAVALARDRLADSVLRAPRDGVLALPEADFCRAASFAAATPELMPAAISLAHKLCRQLSAVRKNGKLPYLRPDGKSQVTVEYGEDGKPARIDAVVISSQRSEAISNDELHADILKHVIQA